MRTLAQTTLPAGDDTLARALEWLDAAGRLAEWPARTVFKLRLCLDEVLTNTLTHGYPRGWQPEGGPRLMLELGQEGGILRLDIVDNGKAFDPTAHESRALDTSLEDARIGGHGLRLLRHYLTDMRYERRDGWNHLALFAALDERP